MCGLQWSLFPRPDLLRNLPPEIIFFIFYVFLEKANIASKINFFLKGKERRRESGKDGWKLQSAQITWSITRHWVYGDTHISQLVMGQPSLHHLCARTCCVASARHTCHLLPLRCTSTCSSLPNSQQASALWSPFPSLGNFILDSLWWQPTLTAVRIRFLLLLSYISINPVT